MEKYIRRNTAGVLYYLIIFLLFCISLSFGQQLEIVTEKILKSEIERENLPLSIHDELLVLMKENVGDNTIKLYLTDFFTNSSVTIDQIETMQPIIAKISNDKKHVIYQYRDFKTNRVISKIYDIELAFIVSLENSHGDVGYPSISPVQGEILYQLRVPNEMPKIYKCDYDGSNNRYMTDGIGGIWSPDGKWFIVKKIPENNITLGKRVREKKITKEEFHKEMEERTKRPVYNPIWLYNSDGKKMIELKEFGKQTGFIKWSPDAKSMAMRDILLGLNILTLRIKDKDILDYQIIPIDERGSDPVWSPDGERLAYVIYEEDPTGDTYINSDIFVSRKDGSDKYNLTNTPDILEEDPVWTSDGNMIVYKKDYRADKTNIVELDLKY